ncbi:MAG: CDC27 family protein, partial [Candidatus Undinarchaeales archaeon]|nr:CDC27 family protein [Candidatus Undinarchaeales archaeon]
MASQAKRKEKEYLNKAEEEFRHWNLKKAFNWCGRVININEKNVMALFLAGQIQYELEKYDEAIEIFTEIISYHQKFSAAWGMAGKCMCAKARNAETRNDKKAAKKAYTEAKRFLTAAIKLDPRITQGIYKSGELIYNLKNDFNDINHFFEERVEVFKIKSEKVKKPRKKVRKIRRRIYTWKGGPEAHSTSLIRQIL